MTTVGFIQRWTLGVLAGVFALGAAAQEPAPAAPAAAEPAAPARIPVVYTIPIRDEIEPALLYIVRRGVKEAVEQKADAIVFLIDTFGGRIDVMQDITRTLNKVDVPTYALVEKNAISAGAAIALSTRKIYMTPTSVIGAAAPIMISPGSGPQEPTPYLREKQVSPTAAMMRAAAEQGGHDPELAEAMVRAEAEFSVDGKLICKAGELLTLTDREAAQPRADGRPLLSAGTVADLPEMLKREGLERAEVREMKVTTAERIARWIQMLASLFLAAGLLGIYIEIKTPGFGLPGILGIACLAIFFWGHHIAGLTGSEDIVLFLLGLILLAIEVFVLPGFGITGVTGILLMVIGLLMAMVEHYPAGPWYPQAFQLVVPVRSISLALILTLTLGLVVARFLPRTPVFHALMLDTAETHAQGYQSADSRPELVGRTGVALTDLRPSGTVGVDGERLDVVTRGDFMDRGAAVRIAEVRGARVVVEPAEPPPPAQG